MSLQELPGRAGHERRKGKPKKPKMRGLESKFNIMDEAASLQAYEQAAINGGYMAMTSLGGGRYSDGAGGIWEMGSDGRLRQKKAAEPARGEVIWTSQGANTNYIAYNGDPSQASWGRNTWPTVWEPTHHEDRVPHPALRWQSCDSRLDHPPHRSADATWNCRGRHKGKPRNHKRALADAPTPGPNDPALCDCACGCEKDGEWHFNDGLCACFYLNCGCVDDTPGVPVTVAP